MLSLLVKLASGFWNTVRRLAGLIIPFLAKAGDFRGVAPGVLRFLGILLLIAILFLLWGVNWKFDLSPNVLAPYPVLSDFFLPIIGFLVYIIIWLGWWLWRLLGPEAEESDFPDIDQAWDEAVRALEKAGVDLREVPLFLVLGRPMGTEAALFEGAQLQLKVANVPIREGAPLHVFANRDGIYVTCAGASLLGRQAAILAGEADSGPGAALDSPFAGAAGGDDIFKTLQPKGRLKEVQSVLERAREQGRKPDQLTEEEKQEIRLLIAQEEQEHAQKAVKPRPLLLKHPEEIQRLTARLKRLCRLIVRDRHPYCPVNGVLLLVSLAATDRKEDAEQTGAICQHELSAVRQGLQVHCPLIALVCDLETVPGFHEFIERFPAEQRQRRVGLRFPLAPDLAEGESVLELVDRGVQWICSTLFPTWIYKLFRVEVSGREELASVVRRNTRLYQLLCQVRDRRKRLGSILVRGLATEQRPAWAIGGCYLASTSRDVIREQAFVPGVFRRLTENQNYVSWTGEAINEEENFQRWTRYGYAGVVAGTVVLVACWVIFWFKK
jgi:hypothetical protein